MSKLAILHAGQLVTLAEGNTPRRGAEARNLGIVFDGGMTIENGLITFVGTSGQVQQRISSDPNYEIIDADGRVVMPGFVDAYTQTWAVGTSGEDLDSRANGLSYAETLAGGGYQHRIVRTVRGADPLEVRNSWAGSVEQMVSNGTTAMLVGAGFGLTTELEIRALQELKDLTKSGPMTMVRGLFAGSLVPTEFITSPGDYADTISRKMLPQAALLANFCGVCCDEGGFSAEHAAAIFRAAESFRLTPVLSTGLTRVAGLEAALAHQARFVLRLNTATDEHIARLAKSDAAAVLLPAESTYLGLAPAPGRKLLDAGAIVALATGCNPATSPSFSMPLTLSLACTQLGMSPAEAITAATLNSAYAIGLHEQVGSLAKRKRGDVVIFNLEDYRDIAYHFGNQMLYSVILGGEEVVSTDWADDTPVAVD